METEASKAAVRECLKPTPFEELEDTFNRTFESCREIMRKKNHDYTSGSQDVLANFRTSEVIGIDTGKGILLRVLDKMKRIQTFIERGELQVDGESVFDALEDTINYMILLKHYIRELQGDFEQPQLF